jgi:hypothetical protein
MKMAYGSVCECRLRRSFGARMPCAVFVLVECQRQPATSMRIALAYSMLPEAVRKEARGTSQSEANLN